MLPKIILPLTQALNRKEESSNWIDIQPIRPWKTLLNTTKSEAATQRLTDPKRSFSQRSQFTSVTLYLRRIELHFQNLSKEMSAQMPQLKLILIKTISERSHSPQARNKQRKKCSRTPHHMISALKRSIVCRSKINAQMHRPMGIHLLIIWFKNSCQRAIGLNWVKNAMLTWEEAIL